MLRAVIKNAVYLPTRIDWYDFMLGTLGCIFIVNDTAHNVLHTLCYGNIFSLEWLLLEINLNHPI